GPHGEGELVDRTAADDIVRMEHRSVAADAVGHPERVALAIGVRTDHIGVVSEYGRPEIGIHTVVSEAAVRRGEDAVLSELLPEDIGDGRHQTVRPIRIVTRLRRETVTLVEVGDAVEAESD